METVITADNCRSSCSFIEETTSLEAATLGVRQHRREIRHLKFSSNAGFCEPSSKRTRSLASNSSYSKEDDPIPGWPDLTLVVRPSKMSLGNSENISGSGQAFPCPQAVGGRTAIASSAVSTRMRPSSTVDLHGSSSGEEDTASSSSGSTSSGSSISSDSSGTSNESTDAEAGSSITSTSDDARPVSIPDTQLESQTTAVTSISQEKQTDRLKGSAEQSCVNLEYTAMMSSTSGGLNFVDDGRCPPHGLVSVCGRRREMEDAVAAVPAFLSVPCGGTGCSCEENVGVHAPLHFFGIYDGHGGSQAAVFCADHLHHALAEEMKSVLSNGIRSTGCSQGILDLHWREAMLACFLRMDAELGGVPWKPGQGEKEDGSSKFCAEPIAPETVGSTAVVAVVGSCQIIVANCGDSRAVLSRGGKAIALSRDHKPDREDEMARVEAAGGRVIFWNGYRVLGVLAMSRAIGDRYLKPYVIAEPEVTCTLRSEEDECLILASDGLWDVLSNELVCEIARKSLCGRRSSDAPDNAHPATVEDEGEESSASVAAALLTKLAIARGSSDNISVVVVDLMTRGSQIVVKQERLTDY
ncbi:hypothetical protein R1sor_025088 [Riccia sorocarpa]|uniref:protein-serine/threonine phosphatase n=1 Tax=Riccia sorocarpa TaxID=122646 RepID=A0ABD3GAP5_9MARC